MNTLNYSIRYLLKNRGNSATRIISLSLGLIVALVIISFVGLKLSYNSFFPDKERIYQVWNVSPQFGLNGVNNHMVMPLAPNMANDIPHIEAATHYVDNLLQINHNGNNIDVSMLNVNQDFFEVLDFGMISGDARLCCRKMVGLLTKYSSLRDCLTYYLEKKILLER